MFIEQPEQTYFLEETGFASGPPSTGGGTAQGFPKRTPLVLRKRTRLTVNHGTCDGHVSGCRALALPAAPLRWFWGAQARGSSSYQSRFFPPFLQVETHVISTTAPLASKGNESNTGQPPTNPQNPSKPDPPTASPQLPPVVPSPAPPPTGHFLRRKAGCSTPRTAKLRGGKQGESQKHARATPTAPLRPSSPLPGGRRQPGQGPPLPKPPTAMSAKGEARRAEPSWLRADAAGGAPGTALGPGGGEAGADTDLDGNGRRGASCGAPGRAGASARAAGPRLRAAGPGQPAGLRVGSAWGERGEKYIQRKGGWGVAKLFPVRFSSKHI